jgi:hypothetical protein
MPKMVALTVRKLKPGTYDEWREAWGSADGPSGAHAWIARKVSDPNEIVAFGIIDASTEELEKFRPTADEEQARVASMAPFIDSVESDGLYEVIDEITF